MSKYLVDKLEGTIRSVHEHPLNFSVSGKYVIDVATFLQIRPDTDVVGDLITEKVSRYKALQPSLIVDFYDELLAAPNVDVTPGVSSRYVYGRNKRVAILPGGFVWTNVIVWPGAPTTIWSHWNGFTLYDDVDVVGPDGPGPSPVRYNYNPVSSLYEEFVPAKFKVEVYDSTMSTLEATLLSDTVQAFSPSTLSNRLRFENLDPDRIWYLSDWIVLTD